MGLTLYNMAENIRIFFFFFNFACLPYILSKQTFKQLLKKKKKILCTVLFYAAHSLLFFPLQVNLTLEADMSCLHRHSLFCQQLLYDTDSGSMPDFELAYLPPASNSGCTSIRVTYVGALSCGSSPNVSVNQNLHLQTAISPAESTELKTKTFFTS